MTISSWIFSPFLAFCSTSLLVVLRKWISSPSRRCFLTSGESLALSYIFVMDIGSSSIRCFVYEVKCGRIRLLRGCSSKVSLALTSASPSQIQKSIDKALNNCLLDLKRSVGRPTNFAIGFSSAAMALVGLDEKFCPVTHLLNYAGTGFNPDELKLQTCALKLTAGSITELTHHIETGTILHHESYAPAQFKALQSDKRWNYEKVKRWQTLAQNAIARWSKQEAQCPISTCEASWTGLFHLRSCGWSSRALSIAGTDPSTMPRVVDIADEKIHYVAQTQTMCDSCKDLEGARLFLALGDGAAATIGCCGDRPNLISVTIGTSAAVRVLRPSRVLDEDDSFHVPGLFCYRVDRSTVLLGGALNDGGSLIEWFRGLVGEEAASRAFEEVERWCEGDVTSLVELSSLPLVLPFWSGERAPGWNSNVTGTMTGLTRATTAAGILFALMEGVCVRLCCILEALVDSGNAPGAVSGRLVASGTGLETNRGWRQMLADVSGYSVLLLDVDGGEMASHGVAQYVASILRKEDISGVGENFGDCNGSDNELKVIDECCPNASNTLFYRKRKVASHHLYTKHVESL